MPFPIHRVTARRIWDGLGRPTIEVDVIIEGGVRGRASAPSGISRGTGEAAIRRDGGAAFAGFDVSCAVAMASGEVHRALRGLDAADQALIDRSLISLDGTPAKSRLGANTMLATSLAAAKAAAAAKAVPLWQHLCAGTGPGQLPLPMIEVLGGGMHARGRLDVQSFSIIAVGADDFGAALDWSGEVFRTAGDMLAANGRLAGIADMGGWWPAFERNEDALGFLVRAIERAGFEPGEDIAIGIDVAASQLGRRGQYAFAREGRRLTSAELAATLLGWLRSYPVAALEDPLGEDDAAALAAFTEAAGSGVAVIADEAACTNAVVIDALARMGAGNAVVIAPDQAGTLTEARAAVDAARAAGWSTVAAARAGETGDAALVHIAVAWGLDLLAAGAFARAERTAKWNEGLRLAEELPTRGTLSRRGVVGG
jgi:enolase